MTNLLKDIVLLLAGAVVGAVGAYVTTPSYPRVETCYEYHTIEQQGDKVIDTHLPYMDKCK